MKSCDICSAPATVTLNSIYATLEVREVCHECSKEIQDTLDKIRKVWWQTEQKYVKRRIRAMRKRGKGE